MSSISSLSQLDIHSISPSPFQPSGVRSRSPTSPSALYPNGGWPSEAAAFHATVDVLLEEHLKAAESAVSEGPLREELRKEIENDCDSIRIMLNAAQVG